MIYPVALPSSTLTVTLPPKLTVCQGEGSPSFTVTLPPKLLLCHVYSTPSTMTDPPKLSVCQSAETEYEAKQIVQALKRRPEAVSPRYFTSDAEIVKEKNNIPLPSALKKLISLIDQKMGKIDADSAEGKARNELKEQLTSFFIKNLPQKTD